MHNYTDNNNFPQIVQVIDDTDPPNAANMMTAPEGALDRTRFLYNRIQVPLMIDWTVANSASSTSTDLGTSVWVREVVYDNSIHNYVRRQQILITGTSPSLVNRDYARDDKNWTPTQNNTGGLQSAAIASTNAGIFMEWCWNSGFGYVVNRSTDGKTWSNPGAGPYNTNYALSISNNGTASFAAVPGQARMVWDGTHSIFLVGTLQAAASGSGSSKSAAVFQINSAGSSIVQHNMPSATSSTTDRSVLIVTGTGALAGTSVVADMSTNQLWRTTTGTTYSLVSTPPTTCVALGYSPDYLVFYALDQSANFWVSTDGNIFSNSGTIIPFNTANTFHETIAGNSAIIFSDNSFSSETNTQITYSIDAGVTWTQRTLWNVDCGSATGGIVPSGAVGHSNGRLSFANGQFFLGGNALFMTSL